MRRETTKPGEDFETALARSAERLDDVCRRMREAGCHDGPLRGPGDHHLATGGKRLRARLTLAAGLRLGIGEADALAAATAVELVHNASLVHDDLMDGDTHRRGHWSVWARDGTGAALLLGDRFLAGAYAQAATTSRPGVLVALLSDRVRTLVDGQARESEPLDPAASGESLQARYLATARAKAGALFALPIEAALCLASVPEATRQTATEAFEAVGTAYQVLDDLDDLEGTKDGRERAADLWQGRLNAPATQYLVSAPAADAAALRRWLRDGPRDGETVAMWRDRLLESDAPASARRLHDLLIDDACARARDLPEPLHDLLDWTARAVARKATPMPAPTVED